MELDKRIHLSIAQALKGGEEVTITPIDYYIV